MTVPTPARHATVTTPPGPFTVVVDTGPDGQDVVIASGWTADVADLLPVVHASLRPAGSELVDRLPVLDEVEKFFEDHPTPSAARTIQQSLERIRLSVRWLELNRDAVGGWLASR